MFLRLIQGVTAVLAGLLLAFAGVIGVEYVGPLLYPFPEGMDLNDGAAMKQHVARYPTGVLLVCACGWWLTVVGSCWLATRLGSARHASHGIVVGTILLLFAILNMFLLPYPAWFWINVIAFPASGLAGIWLARRGVDLDASLSSHDNRGISNE